jgi:hypothetical protein
MYMTCIVSELQEANLSPPCTGFMAIAGEGTLGPCLTHSGGEGGSPRGGGGSFNETRAGGGGGVPSGLRGYKQMY